MRKFFSFTVLAISALSFSAFASIEVKCFKNENASNCMSRVVLEGHNPLVEKMNEIKNHPNNNIYGSFHSEYRTMTKDIQEECSKLSGIETDKCLYKGQQKRMQVLNEELDRLKGLAITDPKPAQEKKKINCEGINLGPVIQECKPKYIRPISVF